MTKPIPAGLQAIFAEMDRQSSDALASFEEAEEVAALLAGALRGAGRLLLLGMGGSHAVNRIAEGLYRRAGLDASALPVSEALAAPLCRGERVVLLASQSGESAEIVRYLETRADREARFGLTLNPASRLAGAVPSLIGHGGMEVAFAATRSLTVTLALHGRVLHELGLRQGEALLAVKSPPAAATGPAADILAGKKAIVFSGRGAMQGVAEAGALGLMELARIPCFALEGGQLRHGPVEALGPDLGVVLIRAAGAAPELTVSMARLCLDAGCPPVVMDASGLLPIPGAVTVALPSSADLAAAFAVLFALQALMIDVAQRVVADVGTPVRSSKITRFE